MPSFDIVSKADQQEVLNAVDNANRELATRFDFRGVQAEFSVKDTTVTMKAEAEPQLTQMKDLFFNKAIKRGLDIRSFESGKVEFSGKTCSQQLTVKQGVEKDLAKKIVALVKDSKLKVQASIQGDEVRITGKKRDDLQEAIALLRATDLGQPLQYQNFRD